LRRQFDRQGRGLLEMMARFQAIRDHVMGIDGAANELHAPPEVFAPLFRMMRRGGVAHASFHVGEDFEHLVSGIRAVWEAVRFLELQSGDRIGHGTALGIDPGTWLRRMGNDRIMLRLQDHLDNQVFAYRLLSASQPSVASWLADDIDTLAVKLYGRSVSPQVLHAAWNFRSLDPYTAAEVHRVLSLRPALKVDKDLAERHIVEMCRDPQLRAELKLSLRAYKELPEAFELFISYHRPEIHARGMEWSEVNLRAIPAEALVHLQHQATVLLNDRNIAIETLPTSNVRISFYDDHEDHHVLRWLGRDPNFASDSPRPTICVGSDDPGIFATNLRNEYAHLFRVLRGRAKLNTEEAIGVLRQLNENGRAFRFRIPCAIRRKLD
jgi:hypothetical protein